jgi:hypothetical protein
MAFLQEEQGELHAYLLSSFPPSEQQNQRANAEPAIAVGATPPPNPCIWTATRRSSRVAGSPAQQKVDEPAGKLLLPEGDSIDVLRVQLVVANLISASVSRRPINFDCVGMVS